MSDQLEKGLRDGYAGTPRSEMLNSSDYLSGYKSGALARYAQRLGANFLEVSDLCYAERDPHRPPTIWLA